MLSFYLKQVDHAAFRALNDACLVFDGKLVINSTFHTNDVAIRAAGPVTKFQRKYHAEPWTHANFNSKEIGVEVRLTSSLAKPAQPLWHARRRISPIPGVEKGPRTASRRVAARSSSFRPGG